jgi:hypothetical protein
MKKYTFFLIPCFLLGSLCQAQQAADSVKAAVNLLFDAMRASDAAGIQNAFADSAILQTIGTNKEGRTVVRNEAVKAFALQVAALPKDSADERIVFETVKIDGPLATVWAPYKFYYAGKFSHCGVDAFQLLRVNGTWKILYLVDTRRKTPCN